LSQVKDQAWMEMKGFCGRHPMCTLSRSCRSKRPVGLLWAWLAHANDPTCRTKEEHRAFRPDFAQRAEARAEFTQLEGAQEWLSAEAQRQPGEEEEPHDV